MSTQPTIPQQNAVLKLLNEGQHHAAERAARRLTTRFPHHSLGWKAAAAALFAQGDMERAMQLCERALRLDAGDWQLHNLLGNALKAANRRDEAIAAYTQAIALAPNTLEPHYNLGLAYIEHGNLAAAEASLQHALTIDLGNALAHLNLANVLLTQHRLQGAEIHFRCALAIMPEASEHAPKLHNNYAVCLRALHRFAEAEQHFRQALTIAPTYATAFSNLGDFTALHGHMDDAVTLLRHAVALDPANAQAHSNLLFTLGHTDISPEQLLAEHKHFAARFEEPLLATHTPHSNVADPNRPLRIGFVSADLRDHPVVRYLRPALRELRNYEGLTLIAYSNSARHDADTAIYQQQFHEWRNVAHLSDASLAQLIRADAIDILIDLSGHSGENRLLTFARKPAPVQISWMGYVGTTGLRSMDYLLADHHLIPPSMEGQFTERILRVSATTVFEPCADAPAVSQLPVLTAGKFTFACLARANKLNHATVTLWAEILHGVPNARLMLACMTDGNPPQSVLAWFAEQGIAASRLWFVHPKGVDEMLRLHQHIDLALDTMPYNGSTTSSHAVWMGVPTLTLPGATAPGRMGAALNLHLGLQEFLAQDSRDYVARAIGNAQDFSLLAQLRPTLRDRMAHSALPDAKGLACELETAWRSVWSE
jgi:protein O-GlcNAc transferase